MNTTPEQMARGCAEEVSPKKPTRAESIEGLEALKNDWERRVTERKKIILTHYQPLHDENARLRKALFKSQQDFMILHAFLTVIKENKYDFGEQFTGDYAVYTAANGLRSMEDNKMISSISDALYPSAALEGKE